MYYKIKNLKVGTKDMKPRIFISSTFYDLKPIREDLYRFISQYNYDPIESEMGDIGYIPGEELDKSCYKAMSDCDMTILIIGGRYGSAATDKEENGDSISVTHKEFRTAVNDGIPIYAFIEQSVDTEYELFKLNKERFSDPKFKFEFSSVDDINVFKFIAELKSISGIPIVTFSKTQDIKDYLAIQWADMFKKYLESLRKNSANKKMTDSVEQMKIIMNKMDIMLDTVGKKILTAGNSKEYESVIEKQKVLAFCADFVNLIQLSEGDALEDKEQRKNYIDKLLRILEDSVNTDIWEKYASDDRDVFAEFFKYFDSKEIDLWCCDEDIVDKIMDNIEIFRNKKLRNLLINEIVSDKNYKKLFEDIKY